MIFTEHHLSLIADGEKTQTRRQKRLDEVRYTEGTVYRATQGGADMFTTIEDCDLFVKVTNMYEEQLGDISEEDCQKEGQYTREEFKQEWNDINGEWDETEIVTVLCIEPVFTHPSEEN